MDGWVGRQIKGRKDGGTDGRSNTSSRGSMTVIQSLGVGILIGQPNPMAAVPAQLDHADPTDVLTRTDQDEADVLSSAMTYSSPRILRGVSSGLPSHAPCTTGTRITCV